MSSAWVYARRIFVLAVLGAFSQAGIADDSRRVVDGVEIYVGIVPAELVRAHPKEHTEGAMHGGLPKDARGQYHVMVALMDAKTGVRITNAQVKAVVSALGFAKGSSVPLELMNVAETITYGNYFYMTGEGPWQIDLDIRLPNGAPPITAHFLHKH